MSTHAAQKALWRAKALVRECKRAGQPPPEQKHLFDDLNPDEVRTVAAQNEYADPWASFIARYQLRVRKA